MTKGKGSHDDKNNRMGQDDTNTNKGADDDGDQGMKTNDEEDGIDEGPANQDNGNSMTSMT